MPVKLNIGLSRKVGEPNYGSRGASIHLEVELENGMLNDPVAMRSHVEGLYALARQSVNDELRRPVEGGSLEVVAGERQRPTPRDSSVIIRVNNGHANNGRPASGVSHDSGKSAVSLAAEPDMHSKPSSTNGSTHGHTNRIAVARATPSQVRAIFALTRRQRLDPHSVISERFRVHRMEDLTIREASAVIDELNRGVGVRS